jgi:hypothetical protein
MRADRGLASSAADGIFGPMPKPSRIIAHVRDALLVFAPLGGLLYFLTNPDAFNTLLDWLVRLVQ